MLHGQQWKKGNRQDLLVVLLDGWNHASAPSEIRSRYNKECRVCFANPQTVGEFRAFYQRWALDTCSMVCRANKKCENHVIEPELVRYRLSKPYR